MHIPVLPKEVIELLKPGSSENFIDATGGQGGHSRLILERTAPEGKLLIIERDEILYGNLRKDFSSQVLKKRVILANDSYTNLKEIVGREKFGPVQGILADLGFSTWHLRESKRGFSFTQDELLDMRYDLKGEVTARDILNRSSQPELERMLRELGEERFARQISRNIVRERDARPVTTTLQLVDIIRRSLPPRFRRQRIHFATRTFQALRIAVNREIENLESFLPQALDALQPGGRLAVISFHSLEDRTVKNFFRQSAKENVLKILTKKPITSSKEELISNPNSRSAKLRAAEKNK